LGIPTSTFRVANRDKYEFHDVELSSTTDVNLHALAIDEQREAFEASVWRRSKFKNFQTKTEQVWFSGVHADVGGGYINQELRTKNFKNSLDDISLDWMIKRIKFHYKDFPINDDTWKPLNGIELREKLTGDVHRSRRGFYLFTPKALRSISNIPIPHKNYRLLKFLSSINVSRDRHASVINESVHISALYKLNSTNNNFHYQPTNLLTVLSKVKESYSQKTFSVGVVNWDGSLLDPASQTDCKIVLDALEAASKTA
jgi:T6SS, Phospholipase effector Tle1-like, catalytic domain